MCPPVGWHTHESAAWTYADNSRSRASVGGG